MHCWISRCWIYGCGDSGFGVSGFGRQICQVVLLTQPRRGPNCAECLILGAQCVIWNRMSEFGAECVILGAECAVLGAE